MNVDNFAEILFLTKLLEPFKRSNMATLTDPLAPTVDPL